jgi:Bacterial PH domain
VILKAEEGAVATDYSQSFSASYDSTAKIVTAFVFIIPVVAAATTMSAVAACVGALILISSYAWSPRSYAIVDRYIVVSRLIGDVQIPIDDIREARPATPEDFRFAIRLFGSGGLFGYYGLFRTNALGKSTWYVTNRKNRIVIITGAKTFVLSPDDVDGFLRALNSLSPQLRPARDQAFLDS